MTHCLKTHPKFFKEVQSGNKPFEIRKNDRDFWVGDTLLLQEFDPEKSEYTRNELERTITYITDFEQKSGFIVMGIREKHYE